MAPRKIIIDTDPGVDDILAMLLAFSALPEELEVLLISVTYGNIDVANCLRNVVSLFHHVEKEIAWRQKEGRYVGFETLRKCKPLVAVGPDHPLADEMRMADFFHGTDGLGGVHESHPHLSPADAWKTLFDSNGVAGDPAEGAVAEEMRKNDALFTPSKNAGHQDILRLLREHEPDSISIVAIGPLTNLALAAAADPDTFLRAKEVIVMGGNIDEAGNVPPPAPSASAQAEFAEPPFRLVKAPLGRIRNELTRRNQITPVAEFNTFADATAAARVYALSSPRPETTMPPSPPEPSSPLSSERPPPHLAPYPKTLSRRLKVTLFPLDITSKHILTRGAFRHAVTPLLRLNSPLAEWTSAFMTSTFDKIESLQPNASGDEVGLALHDPLCIWYCMTSSDPDWKLNEDEDIRVETSGQWTRGMCVVDRRDRRRREDKHVGEVAGDTGNWLSGDAGNRLRRCVGSPGEEGFGGVLLERIFAL